MSAQPSAGSRRSRCASSCASAVSSSASSRRRARAARDHDRTAGARPHTGGPSRPRRARRAAASGSACAPATRSSAARARPPAARRSGGTMRQAVLHPGQHIAHEQQQARDGRQSHDDVGEARAEQADVVPPRASRRARPPAGTPRSRAPARATRSAGPMTAGPATATIPRRTRTAGSSTRHVRVSAETTNAATSAWRIDSRANSPIHAFSARRRVFLQPRELERVLVVHPLAADLAR